MLLNLIDKVIPAKCKQIRFGKTTEYAYGIEMIEKFEDGIRYFTGEPMRQGRMITAYECDTTQTRTYEVRAKDEEER